MSDSPYLGRCKDCDFAIFATSEQIKQGESFKDVRANEPPVRIPNYGVYARCPQRHKAFMLRQIKGTYSKDHKCDSRCLNAKGHECTCSCGGVNHGRGYAVEIVAAETSSKPSSGLLTEKQANFIKRLLDERTIPEKDGRSGEQRREDALAKLESFTVRQASATIEWLLTLPKKEY